MITVLFWIALALIVYSYVLYPLLLVLRGLLFRQSYTSAETPLTVSILIAARNEAQSIEKKLLNMQALDYPRERLEIIIASDGSTDATEAIVRGWANQGVKLLALPRMGKADALNAAVAASTGEILVFSDANSMFEPDAIWALVRPFADSRVGGVAGNQRYLNKKGLKANQGEQSYWNFDRLLKTVQSAAGNTISATGAIYAIRRSLFQSIPAGVTDDFVTSTRVIAQGYRLVFAPDAVAFEPASQSNGAEFARKVRITTRGLQGVLVMRQLLNPFRYGFYAVELFSHKILRRLVVFPLILLAITSPFLWNSGLFYQLATLAQLGFYGLALFGLLVRGTALGHNKLIALPLFFCVVYAASLLATINILRGRRIDRWEPQRVDPANVSSANGASSADGASKSADSGQKERIAHVS